MPMNNEIDALIEAGWYVLESDFSEVAFRHWRKEALKCLTLLVGAEHPYTHHFRSTIMKAERRHILAGLGMLTAATLGGSAGEPSAEGPNPVVPAPVNGSSRDLRNREAAHHVARDWGIS